MAMERRENNRPIDHATDNADAVSRLAQVIEQRLRILMDQSKSAHDSGAIDDDLVFRLAQDRRRSKTNILPYRQRRATDLRR